MITDADLRTNHEFVSMFEQVRRHFGATAMSDAVLSEIAERLDVSFELLRRCRHLRNALAHDAPVNQEAVRRHLAALRLAVESSVAPAGPVGQEDSPASGPGERQVFRIHAWHDPDLERRMLAHGFVSMGGEEIGDLSAVRDPSVISDALTNSMPDRAPAAIRIFVGYWRRFLWEAGPGDIVLLPLGPDRVAVGQFSGPYSYAPEADPRARHRRTVDWTPGLVDRHRFSDALRPVLSGRHTIQRVKPSLHPEIFEIAGLA